MPPRAKPASYADDLPKLAAPARRALASAGIARVADLRKHRAEDVAALHGMGPNAMKTLRAAMKTKGVAFARDAEAPKAKAKAKATTATDVDAYMAKVPPHQRPALEKVRATIRAAVPDAVERMSYGMPTFGSGTHRLHLAAYKDHLSLFGANRDVQARFPQAKPFVTSVGTLQFTPEKPLPAALVRKIAKARLRAE